jgi:hypothetical protein
MPQNPEQRALADPKRFKTIQDLTQLRPDCSASIEDMLLIDNGSLLIIDLSHIGYLLNPYNSPIADYVRTHGVIVCRDVHPEYRPIFWREPFLLLPMSCDLNENLISYADVGMAVGQISCASGSLLFMPVRSDMPAQLGDLIDKALAKEPGMQVMLPIGAYRVFYEQFEPAQDSDKERYRNIVVRKQ